MSEPNRRLQEAQNIISDDHVSSSMAPGQHTKVGNVEVEAEMTGIGGLLPGMTKEYSGWDVYNNEARKVDTELVKDWTSNLNSLLLFASIFAAVLTAFIMESKKLLELDPADVMLSVMIFHINNVANGTYTIYTQPDFTASSSAVTINCLFFTSLSLSLVAALASVVALQWVGDYDAAITRGGSSPEDRAKRRQFRHSGVISWRMGEIIAIIPLMLYCSVILFLSGLTLWMWTVNQMVGTIIAGGGGAAMLFYGGTTTIAVTFVSAPFRTPLSQWIYSLLHLPLSLAYLVARVSRDSFLPAWLEERAYVWGPARFNLTSERLANALRLSSVFPWLQARHVNGSLPSKREDREVGKRKELGINAMAWLATQLSISQDSYNRLFLLASEIPKLKDTPPLLASDVAPLLPIFGFLSLRLLNKNMNEEITEDEIRGVGILARCYQTPAIRDIVVPTIQDYESDHRLHYYWWQYCLEIRALNHPSSQRLSSKYPNPLFLFFRDVPIPLDREASEAALRLSRWRNKLNKDPKNWCQIADFGFKYSSDFFDEYNKTLQRFIGAQGSRWWEQMARYLAKEYQGPYRPSILRTQASALPNVPGTPLWHRALWNPQLLSHLRDVFEYPVPCSEHYDDNGHLLLHAFNKVPSCDVYFDLTVNTVIRLRNRTLDALLMLLLLPHEYDGHAQLELRPHIAPECFSQLMEIIEGVKMSQFSLLALLSDLCSGILNNDANGILICSEDVAAASICARRALELPWDPRTSSLLSKLDNRMQKLEERMRFHHIRSLEEHTDASLIASQTINRLYTYVAVTSVSGRQNCRLLSCAQATKDLIPAVGWLSPHFD